MKRLEACIDEIRTWLTANSLKLNEAKSDFILFGTKHNINKINIPSIRIGSANITHSLTCRYLGVIFDSQLTFNDHISSISKSVRFHLHNLGFIRRYLNRTATEQLVHALISFRLDFCNSLLHNIPQYQLNRLQPLQNAAARLVTLTKRYDHISPVLKSLHWLPVCDRITFKVLLLAFHTLCGRAPEYHIDALPRHTPTRNLRSSQSVKLIVPRTRRSWGTRAFQFSAASLWNNLPSHIISKDSTNQFKRSLKTHLFTI